VKNTVLPVYAFRLTGNGQGVQSILLIDPLQMAYYVRRMANT
jgi:hypothetical protein